MRTIAIGDIHGCYNELKTLIDELIDNGYYDHEMDRIVFLGDYVDRGENSREVIKYIREMQMEYGENVIALMGNHEEMLLSFCDEIDMSWIYNGYDKTIMSYIENKDDFYSDLEWIRELPMYFEDDNFIYVHAGINPYKDMENQNIDDLLWSRDFVVEEKECDKIVIFGHTPTEMLTGSTRPYITSSNNVDIDTGCVYGGALTALIVEDDMIVDFYQVEKESLEDSKEAV